MKNVRRAALWVSLALLGPVTAMGNTMADEIVVPALPGFHLTGRPFVAVGTTPKDYLDALEPLCRCMAQFEDGKGAIVDPILHREHQYGTPYFAVATAVLIHAGRAKDLLPAAVRAMDHATACFAKGDAGIPDKHGEFFMASLPTGLEAFKTLVPAEQYEEWKKRLATPVKEIVHGPNNNWRAYAMKGEWLRAVAGIVGKAEATAFVEEAWAKGNQRSSMTHDPFGLYEDRQTDPDSLAVESVGRGNLLGLVAEGYDGPPAKEIAGAVERGTIFSLLLQDPTGQCPPNGRTDDHVWNDVLYQLCFEVMAEREQAAGNAGLAGQFRRAADLSFGSIARWKQTEGKFAGSYFITKNHFDPALRVGYQTASNFGNYNGALMLHLAEAYLARKTEITEEPAPCEIGGYAFVTAPTFDTAVANAGGMQMLAALRGDVKASYGQYWTTLGVERFWRGGWESRLGPSDGGREVKSGKGVTFAPAFLEQGEWKRMAEMPERYRGRFSVAFAHPLLVRCAIEYAPIVVGDGPTFRQEFIVTPDGVLATMTTDSKTDCAVTYPLLENDGTPLLTTIAARLATTAYAADGDQQAFLALDKEATLTREDAVRSTYGDLRAVRVSTLGGVNHTFIYPRNNSDLAAQTVLDKFTLTDDGFVCPLCIVGKNIYIGRTAAGGFGAKLDLPNARNSDDVIFSVPCNFIAQSKEGKIVTLEVDRACSASGVAGKIEMKAFVPVKIP